VSRDDAQPDVIFQQLCRRLQFLKRKLIADLKQGSKIFVFKLTPRNLTTPEISRLHKAMRHYGENTLLYVRYAEPDRPDGTVELIAPGLMIGYIDRFAVGRDGEELGPATPLWAAICKKAYDLWLAKPATA
jgi:hypothetical protein